MKKYPIGVILDSFKCGYYEAMDKAVEIGANGFQVYASRGELYPENLTSEKKKEFIKNFKDRGLVISALCGDLGKGFTNSKENPVLIDKSKRIIELAKEMGTNIVTTHIGRVPEDNTCDTYKIMQEACHELAEYADSLDAHFAIETGPEPSKRLKAFLDTLGSTGVAVNLDPANLTMCVSDDAVEAVYTLQKYIVHTHAKDGICLTDGKIELNSEQEIQAAQGKSYLELPLGQGGVDWKNYLKALEEIGYNGFLTIEREVGENPSSDISLAANFLRSFF